MQILLHVLTSQNGGRRLWLRQNQELRIGRSDWADVALPADPTLADVHFKVICQPEACRLVDLSRSPGTYVNGVRVVERTLADGDRIRAGQSQFAVAIDVGARAPVAGLAGSASARPLSRLTARCSNAGLTVLQSSDHGHGLDDVIELLSSVSHPFAVFNDRRLGVPISPTHRPCVDLLDGLPEVVRSYHSLWLMPLCGSCTTAQFLAQIWGRDAVTIVASHLSLTDLAANLRHAAPSFLSPALLRKQLLTAPAPFVRQLLAGVQAVVVEADHSDGWLLLTDAHTARTCQEWRRHDAPAA